MPKKRGSKKKKGSGGDASKPWLPDPKSVIEVKEVRSPAGGPLRIIRTNIVDPYETPLAAPKRPGRKRK
jgi:hypothetical protein